MESGQGRRGARPRALGAILLAMIAWAFVPRPFGVLSQPASGPWAGVELDGQLRMLELSEAQALVREELQSCRADEPSPLTVDSGAALLGPPCERTGAPLPLGAARTLGLPVDLNALTEADFESLPGIGPALARRIVETRAELGGFRTFDQLLDVRGIGPAKLRGIRAALNPDAP